MRGKRLTLAIVLLMVCVPLVVLFVCTRAGYADGPPGFKRANPSEQAEEAIDAHKPITPGGDYERLVFIHYAKGGIPGPPDKGDDPPEDPPEDPPPDPSIDNTYFELLGITWDVPEGGVPFLVDLDYAPAGSFGEIEAGFHAWDEATSIELFADPVPDSSAGPSTNYPDGENTVSWRRIVPPRAIAVTFTWYDTETSKIVDSDVVMNTKHEWGIDEDGEGTAFVLGGAFDVRNIFTHEAGHVVGLADLYDDIYRELTMYGYGSKGETQKISLEEGDELGCQELYAPDP
jgi:hypothetical protein